MEGAYGRIYFYWYSSIVHTIVACEQSSKMYFNFHYIPLSEAQRLWNCSRYIYMSSDYSNLRNAEAGRFNILEYIAEYVEYSVYSIHLVQLYGNLKIFQILRRVLHF